MDSKKSKSKARAYFYVRANNMYFCCHNCGRSWTFGHFLRELDPTLYDQYRLERYRNGETGHSNYPKKDLETPDAASFAVREYRTLIKLPTIAALESTHYAREYLVDRKIPEKFLNELYFAEDFKTFIDSLLPGNDHPLYAGESRIVIPFIDKEGRLLAVQGRAFAINALRYITIKMHQNVQKIWGLNHVDTHKRVFLVEGPFDAMCLYPHACAMGGADGSLPFDPVLVLDNEPRNVEIVKRMKKAIDAKKRICIWPSHIQEKDINDMILSGRTMQEIVDILDSNTFSGLSAQIALQGWAKCQ